jgi:enamine deaminase RidA (YjgF/YER057c/UK114 family)
MERVTMNPTGLSKPNGYSHVVTVRDATLVFVAGQVAYDADGGIVGHGDLRAQAEAAYRNLGIALAAAGATYGDVVSTTIFVVGYRPEMVGVLREARASFFPNDRLPAATLVGVTALAREGLLIEVEAIAAIR